MDIEQRLANLERSVKLWRGVTVCLVLALVVGVTVAATESEVADELKCRSLFVVDEKGTNRIGLMASHQSGPGIFLWDEEVMPRAILESHAVGPRLSLWAEDGPCVELSVRSTDGSGVIEIRSPEDAVLVKLDRTVCGDGVLVVNAKDGREGVRVEGSTLFEDTGGYLSIRNRTGEKVVTLCGDEYGNGVVGAYDRKGKGRTLKP